MRRSELYERELVLEAEMQRSAAVQALSGCRAVHEHCTGQEDRSVQGRVRGRVQGRVRASEEGCKLCEVV